MRDAQNEYPLKVGTVLNACFPPLFASSELMKALQSCLILVRFVFHRTWKLVTFVMLGIVAVFCLAAIAVGVFWVKRSKEDQHASFNYAKHTEDA